MGANIERLRADVEFLASVKPARNYRHPHVLKRVAEYIRDSCQALGCEPQLVPFCVDGETYYNVTTCLGPPKEPRIIVGAHYDVYGENPGADDNASGVAGLLETARLLHERQAELRNCVELVAYALEEPPFFATEHMGSAVHAEKLHDSGVQVLGMICYEMIGYYSDEPMSQRFPNPVLAAQYPSTGNFVVVVGRVGQEAFTEQVHRLMQAHTSMDVQRINLPESSGLADLSDHRNYWLYNYPAVMLNDTAFLRNPNYHTYADTPDQLDFPRMAEVVNGAVGTIIGL